MASNRRRATSRRGGGIRTKRRNRVLVRYPDSASASLRHQTKMHANPDADLRRFARLRAYAFEVRGDERARGSVRARRNLERHANDIREVGGGGGRGIVRADAREEHLEGAQGERVRVVEGRSAAEGGKDEVRDGGGDRRRPRGGAGAEPSEIPGSPRTSARERAVVEGCGAALEGCGMALGAAAAAAVVVVLTVRREVRVTTGGASSSRAEGADDDPEGFARASAPRRSGAPPGRRSASTSAGTSTASRFASAGAVRPTGRTQRDHSRSSTYRSRHARSRSASRTAETASSPDAGVDATGGDESESPADADMASLFPSRAPDQARDARASISPPQAPRRADITASCTPTGTFAPRGAIRFSDDKMNRINFTSHETNRALVGPPSVDPAP